MLTQTQVPQLAGSFVFMKENQDSFYAFPCTFKVHYDGVLPPLPKS